MGCGVFVKEGKTFTLISGQVKDNTAGGKNNNVFLNGTKNAYVPSTGKRSSDTARIIIGGDLSKSTTQVGITVEAFEMDPDHQALYFSVDKTYGDTNKGNSRRDIISKFIFADNDDWAIVLVEGDSIEIQDTFTTGSNVAIAINQWKYLQDMIFRAITGNSKNTSVVVSQNVVAQDTDNRLIVGDPNNYDGIKPYQGVSNPLTAYGPAVADNKKITLDLHGYSINRLLKDAEPKGDGYVIRVDNGYELTIVNVNSSKIGKVTGGHNLGDGGGIFVDKGGSLIIDAGDITNNKAGTGSVPGNGGGVYVSEGASFKKNLR